MINPATYDVAQIDKRGVIDPARFERWLLANEVHPEQLARGEIPGHTIETAKITYVCQDPVLWCKAFLREPNPTDEQVELYGDPDNVPYIFFDYQEPSVRAWGQNAIHQDAAEVGKTREIVGLILWGQGTGMGFTVRNPSMLVAAPQQTHLDEIIREVELHMGESDSFTGDKPMINRLWLKPKKHPHYMHRFKGPTCTKNGEGKVYYRPAGHDGEAFRGVHVNALGLYDEAAKSREDVVWSEFHRALMPGCKRRYYSVPNGDNSTRYYAMTQEAKPDLKPGEPGLRLFHWPKTLMPPPFWDEKRKQEKIAEFGGEDSPGYTRNVLGEHGQQENAVWPFDMLMRNTRELGSYRAIKLTANESDGTLHVLVYSVELRINDGKKTYRLHHIADRHDDLAEYKDSHIRREAMAGLVAEFAEPLPNAALWAGADLGFSMDPTELLVAQEVGAQLRDHLRVYAKGVDYPMQCELIYAIDKFYNKQCAWGVDFGNAGTAVVQQLQTQELYEAANFEQRLTGFTFSMALDCQAEDGEPLMEEKNGKQVPVRKPGKNLATEDLITPRFQAGTWHMPYDPDVIDHHSNHTAREGQRHLIYSKTNDHCIDARRALILRKTFNEVAGNVNVFSSGAYQRPAA